MVDRPWALAQISKLLPLDEGSLNEVLDYTETLNPGAGAEHLQGILGDGPQALEFISSYNARRKQGLAAEQVHRDDGPPKSRGKGKKTKAPLNALPPTRRPDDYGNTRGGYRKGQDDDDRYSIPKSTKGAPSAAAGSLDPRPAAIQAPRTSDPPTIIPKLPPSAAGPTIVDLRNVKTRTASPSPAKQAKAQAKVALTGGTAMHGASTELSDLDSAIRSLELQTNPSLAETDNAARACDCQATKHPLLTAAPNCLKCGKIICLKEGLGPCTFCGEALLSQDQIQEMLRSLKDERGKERMAANNAGNKRADVAGQARPFQPPAAAYSDSSNAPLSLALAHRDKLLNFQAQNARRTRVHDEAADFDTTSAGLNQWASPMERARQLKMQQKMMREMDLAARPEWERKKQMVVSLEVVNGKVVRRTKTVNAQDAPEVSEDQDQLDSQFEDNLTISNGQERQSGAFRRNPLLGGMVRPLYNPGKDAAQSVSSKGKGKATMADDGEDPELTVLPREQRSRWRRVQDDNDDNEAWILDGGVYGGRESERRFDEEHAVGS